MITETSLLAEFNMMSASAWKYFTGDPFHWDANSGVFTVNRKSLILPFLVDYFNHLGIAFFLLSSWRRERNHDTETEPLNYLTICVCTVCCVGSFFITCFCSINILDRNGVEAFNTAVAKFEINNIRGEDETWKTRLKTRYMTRLAIFTCKWIRISAAQMLPIIAGIGAYLDPEMPFNFLRYFPGKVLLLGSDELAGLVHYPVLRKYFHGIVLFLGNMLIWKFPAKYWSLCFTQIAAGCTGLSNAVLQSER